MFQYLAILFGAAFLSPLLCRFFPRSAKWLLALIPAWGAYRFWNYENLLSPEIYNWAPNVGLRINLHADAWGSLFAVLITSIGCGIVIYGGEYLKKKADRLGYFYMSLFLFMAGMLGVVLSQNILGLFVFWELTSVSSYLLISFNNKEEKSRYSALQALLVTGAGGLCMLSGFLGLGQLLGSFDLPVMMGRMAERGNDPSLSIWCALILIGILTKSAQVPFHFWLPNAMAAPTPVSAYLHSATMVKAGVFLAARLTPLFQFFPTWMLILKISGFLTLLWASVQCLIHRDAKKILANTTLAALGTMIFLISFGTEWMMKAAILFIVAHAYYKVTFFMIAGIVDHATGTRDLFLLSELRKKLPMTAWAATFGAWAFAGLPPTFSFLAKEEILSRLWNQGDWLGLLGVSLSAIVFVVIALLFSLNLFWWGRNRAPADDSVHSVPFALWFPPLAFSLVNLVLGLFPTLISHRFLIGAVIDTTGSPLDMKLSHWHGFTPALFLTMLVVASGCGIYVLRYPLQSWGSKFLERVPPMEGIYKAFLNFVYKGTPILFARLQNGSLRFYTSFVLLFAVFLGFFQFFIRSFDFSQALNLIQEWSAYESLLWILLILGAVLAVVGRNLLVSLSATGIIGLGCGAFYAFYGAPDLAITQILVESLTLFLVLWVFYEFPRTALRLNFPTRIGAIVVSTLASLLIFVSVFISYSTQLFPTISGFFAEESYLKAHGRNVVNVILVDFRGYDTMGEITVLAIAAIGVAVLFTKWRGRSA